MTLDLATLLADPARVAEVPPEQVPALLVQIAAVQTALAARLAVPIPAAANGHGEDRLLTADEAAERLGVTKDWLRRQKTLPFRVEVSPGQIRYSARGLERFIARRAG